MGAQALYALASQAEDAARLHQPEVLARLLVQLPPALQGWDVAAEQSQPQATQTQASASQSADTSPLDPATLARIGLLRDALEHHDLAALDEWEVLSPVLAGMLGAERQASMQQHLDALEFDEALVLLDSALPSEYRSVS